MLAGPCLESGCLTMQFFMVYGDTKLKAHFWSHWLQPASPLQSLGALPHSGTTVLFVTLDILESQSYLGLCCASLPDYLSGKDTLHWNRLLKVPISHSRAISLSVAGLKRLPSPAVYLPRYPFRLISLYLYLAKSGDFSICRLAAILFFELRLSSQVFRIIW